MEAPTREEIRLAVAKAWARAKVDIRLEETLAFDFACAATSELYGLDEDDLRPDVYGLVRDKRIDAALAPLLADVQTRAMEAVADAIQGFASEYPNAPRYVTAG